MAKRTVDIEFMASFAYRLTFDDASPEYKDSLESFTSIIDKYGDEKTMLKHLVSLYSSARETSPEGIGLIKVDGFLDSTSKMPFSGINLEIIHEEQEEMEVTEVRTCKVCGCTEDNACVTDGETCHWVDDNLCSHCKDKTDGPQTETQV